MNRPAAILRAIEFHLPEKVETGADLASAVRNTYAAVQKIHFAGMHYRKDIARKGFERWPQAARH